MKPIPLQTVCLAVLLLALPPAQAAQADSESDARQWLERMIQTARSLNYEGTFVYAQGQHLEAMHIVHGGGPDGERQRMFSLNGARREVLVANQQVICLLPEHQTAFNGTDYKRSLFPISLPRQLDELVENYRFEMQGDDRVADRATRIIVIKPRDELRYGYRLWLEHKTAMVLRSVLFDEKGQTLEQMMFTDLDIKQEIDAQALEPPASVQKTPPTGIAPGEQVLHSDWALADLPQGFSKVMHSRFVKAANAPSTEHMVLTDGLATVSIFVEPLRGEDAKPLLEGASQMGAMNAFGSVVHRHQVLVVGEVPQATVKAIAASVQYGKETAAK